MKNFFTFLILPAFLLVAVETQAQTFGGGIAVTGNTNALMQNSPGVICTNYLTFNSLPRTLVLSGISSTNEIAIGYYGFTIPTNYFLLPGTTNVYVTVAFTNSFAAGTNGGTWTTNVPYVSQQVPTIGVMGLGIGAFTNTAYATP